MSETEGRKPLVSIGLPIYNGEAFVRKAIDTLLAQTFEDFELIVSDNASTDSTPSILADYADRDSRVVIHRQPRNIGVKANFVYVMERSRGDYFMWAAHDDYWMPNYLEELLALHDEHAEASLCCGDITKVSTEDEVLEVRSFPDASSLPLFERITLWQTTVFRLSAFYGLHRRAPLVDAVSRILVEAPVWGGDVLLTLDYVYNDSIRATTSTTFFQRIVGLSASSHPAVKLGDSLRQSRTMLRLGLRSLLGSEPAATGRLTRFECAKLYLPYCEYVLTLTHPGMRIHRHMERWRRRFRKLTFRRP